MNNSYIKKYFATPSAFHAKILMLVKSSRLNFKIFVKIIMKTLINLPKIWWELKTTRFTAAEMLENMGTKQSNNTKLFT